MSCPATRHHSYELDTTQNYCHWCGRQNPNNYQVSTFYSILGIITLVEIVGGIIANSPEELDEILMEMWELTNKTLDINKLVLPVSPRTIKAITSGDMK